MQTMIENLINGNLKDARRQARGKGMMRIATYLRLELGWSLHRATAAAYYLKTGEGWQDYCDAV